MSDPGTPTFDQLRVFLAIVETGSFAAAGRRLNRATSVISYGIANLEAQLGVQLFDRQATRKPRLSVAGQAVLAEARAVSHGIDGLRSKVKGLLQGLEAEVHLAVDVMLPSSRLSGALKAFQAAFPTVTLRLHAEAIGGVPWMVLEGRAAVGVAGPLAAEVAGLERIALGRVTMVPVAAPDHPLARLHPITPGVARDHLQLVLTDRSPLTAGRDFRVLSPRTWRLADLSVKHALLRDGIGWGNMPKPMVADDLASGRLVMLDVPDQAVAVYAFDGIYRSDSPPGPAATWLLAHFAAQANYTEI
ncbi:DNA-binding transcriptional regulator, LysR family [Sphingomonas sp. YR710]|uniref:LysR family transcriptional regulator n=1 Tax=Sphingomonas sp. YR710 TaxID=1882773 RepID=UPI0008886F06|nr:LysR family transcriptional regulator [Sphingomonas sp. YR710]SDC85426.1 DNA-binding transcriptional regulator, LysR family [Sphingomonas sp. YR710]